MEDGASIATGWVLDTVVFPLMAGLYWTMRSINKDQWIEINKCRDNMSGLQTHIAENYASKEYMREMKIEIMDHLIRIESKLDKR